MKRRKSSGKKTTRRRVKVAGKEVTTEKEAKDLSFAEVLKLDQEEPQDAPDSPPERTYHPDHIEEFMRGNMTLGDLEGITKQQQYQIAELGYNYLKSGKLDEAKKVFVGLLALDPFDAYFHVCLGSIAQQQDELEEADARYSRALEINPYSATALGNRGEIRVMVGRLAEGAEDLVKAVKLDPDEKDPASVRARATIRVLKEQLGAIDPTKLKQATGSKIKAAKEAVRKQPRARPRPRPKAKRPGPKKG